MKWIGTIQGTEAERMEVKLSAMDRTLEQMLNVMLIQRQSDLHAATEHCKPENKRNRLHQGIERIL